MATAFRPLKTARLSLPLQAQHYLHELIENGTYQPGEQLPSQEDLAIKLGISRATLREALHKLEMEGVILRRHGVGTFVAPNFRQRLETGLEVLESLESIARKSGLQARMDMLSMEEHPADAAERQELDLCGQNQDVLAVSRVMLVDDRPVAHLVDVLPTRFLSCKDLERDFGGSVLDVLIRIGQTALSYSYTHIETVAATPALAHDLAVHRKAPLLKLEAHLYAQDGQIVDYSISHFVPGYFNFHVVRRIGA